jgi:hypothetical protein
LYTDQLGQTVAKIEPVSCWELTVYIELPEAVLVEGGRFTRASQPLPRGRPEIPAISSSGNVRWRY